MAATETEEQVKLKLLVNIETNKVIFAEAKKDFVDVLLSFLTLPLATIARLVNKESDFDVVRLGCLNSLYDSVANLDNEFLWTASCKEMLLRPRNSSVDYCSNLKINMDDSDPDPSTTKYFICRSCCGYLLPSPSINERCRCGRLKNFSIRFPGAENACSGFVNGVATFIITDDLIVMPNSVDTLVSIGQLQKCGMKSLSSVKEMTVNVTKKKVLDLLKCCLSSKSTLTDLFLETKPFLERSIFSPCGVANSSNIQINLKLVTRRSNKKILFAQGNEDFADFLINFLTLPLGGVENLLGGHSSLGSVDGMYKSIVDLDEEKYLMSKEVKNRLVDPCLPLWLKNSSGRREIDNQCVSQYYCCEQRTYSKGPAMYMATDDLALAPASPILAISLLNSLKVPLSDVKEMFVIIGINEGLSILKASLTSTSALTNGLAHFLSEAEK